MGRFLFYVFLLVLVAVGVCFFMGWFQISVTGDRWDFKVHFTADKEKIEEAEQKGKKELENVRDKVKKSVE